MFVLLATLATAPTTGTTKWQETFCQPENIFEAFNYIFGGEYRIHFSTVDDISFCKTKTKTITKTMANTKTKVQIWRIY